VTVIDQNSNSDAWLRAAYSNDVIVTQLDERGSFTSSCSMPFMVFLMLDALDLEPGMSVLEIGTGTGWTAALTRAFGAKVVSIEVDKDLSRAARKNLRIVGMGDVRVITKDGVGGYQLSAPYDRVHVTCSVHSVPYAWVDQTKVGGVLVVPIRTPLNSGGIVRLTVGADGSACGPFIHTAAFMWLRAQAFMPPDQPDDFDTTAEQSHMNIHESHLFDSDAMFVTGHLVPNCMMFTDENDEGNIERIWLHGNDSWASIDGSGGILQLGPRRLWDEVVSAHDTWVSWGKPGITQLGLTVERDRQSLWLEQPSQVVKTRFTF
jgi:protein-L-isoaspartate(D-aspartate) O-methyltransferase